MREQLYNELSMAITSQALDGDTANELQNKFLVILNNYEISKRETEIVVRSEDRNKVLLQKFLIAKSVSGRTKRTIEYYKKELFKILMFINKPADEITTDDIRYYLAVRQTQHGISKTTANNELRILKSFFSFLLAEEIVARNPCLKIEQIKQTKKQKTAFSEMEVEKIRNACRNGRESAMVEVLLSTGCRVSELAGIMIEDIKGDSVVVRGKGEKYRTVYLNAKAILSINNYLAERNDNNPYLFCGGKADSLKAYNSVKGLWYTKPELIGDGGADKSAVGGVIRNIGKRAGVEKVHPHRFRRTCATFALRRGMPIEQVSKMLGHESIDTTMIYLDLSENELQQSHKKYVT